VPDARFFTPAGPFTLEELAAASGAAMRAGADARRRFAGIAALDEAGPGEVSFLENRRYVDAFARTRAGCCVAEPRFAERAPAGAELLLTATPYKAFALIARKFYPEPAVAPGRHASAVIAPTARIDPSARIDAGAAVGERAEIGARVWIGANTVIGDGVVVGEDAVVGSNATLQYCLIGKRALIHSGARIGSRGFGFATDAGRHLRIPQVGRVLIGDDVEVGANACIDRGAGTDTVIGDGVMIDNLVMIGHNVKVGRGCVLVAQVGVSGSTRLGDYVMIGGQGGLSGHLNIGAGARIAAGSGVIQDVEAGATVGGYPAVPVRQWHRQSTILARLAKGKAPDDKPGDE
jgi:UDP-3-O-[3-hydroxymyristoyl] glucosamine N-acyltransferase